MTNWGSLGDYVFQPLNGPVSEGLDMSSDLAEHPRVGRKPTLQHTGAQLQKYSLSLALHQQTTDINAALAYFRQAMEAGEILDLVIGNQPDTGALAGQWVIQEIKIASIARLPGGHPLHCEVELKLIEYVECDDLEVSARKPDPPAVKKPAAQKPKQVTGPGYHDDTLPPPI